MGIFRTRGMVKQQHALVRRHTAQLGKLLDPLTGSPIGRKREIGCLMAALDQMTSDPIPFRGAKLRMLAESLGFAQNVVANLAHVGKVTQSFAWDEAPVFDPEEHYDSCAQPLRKWVQATTGLDHTMASHFDCSRFIEREDPEHPVVDLRALINCGVRNDWWSSASVMLVGGRPTGMPFFEIVYPGAQLFNLKISAKADHDLLITSTSFGESIKLGVQFFDATRPIGDIEHSFATHHDLVLRSSRHINGGDVPVRKSIITVLNRHPQPSFTVTHPSTKAAISSIFDTKRIREMARSYAR